MEWVYNDGGRSKYFTATDVGDCAVRAVAIATGKDYKEVYDAFKVLNKGKSCRDGTPKKVDKKYLTDAGWIWHPCMTVGSGCTTHLTADELPKGTLIVSVSKHLTCVKDGVIHDTYDCSRGGTRCVYGYWTPPPAPVVKKRQAKGLTHEEREKLANAFDIVREVFSDVRDRRGCSQYAKKLDAVLERLEPMAFHLD